MSSNVCIIPARGGSKRIPKKNIIDFFEKPMISWTIEAALKSRLFSEIKIKLGLEYDNVVQLMANCPLRGTQDIRNSFNNFLSKKLEFQISSFKFGWMNPWWSVKISETGKPIPIFPESLKTRSQDLPDLYCPTGAIWIAKVPALLRANTFYGPGY